jgi:chromosome segregation and condensation protein ScpB
MLDKQTVVTPVQNVVQTAVQTNVLENLSLMERAIVWALANSDQKLSYEDLAVVLGKDKSTIRGQINAIRQKSEGLIEESREANGKKRLYIPEEMRQIMLKNGKVRVKLNSRDQKFK